MTYSIAARCEKSGAFGIAITSSSICVASRCAWVGPLGAVSTQNITDPALGPAGLALLRQGLGAGAVLDLLLAGTPQPDYRQVGVIDRYGMTALHSGKEALPLAAFAQGPSCIALGNLLAASEVPSLMIAAFTEAAGETLAERLMRGLEAGFDAGGETGDGFAIQGNCLAGEDVVLAMVAAWQASSPDLPLAHRLLASLSGPDRRDLERVLVAWGRQF